MLKWAKNNYGGTVHISSKSSAEYNTNNGPFSKGIIGKMGVLSYSNSNNIKTSGYYVVCGSLFRKVLDTEEGGQNAAWLYINLVLTLFFYVSMFVCYMLSTPLGYKYALIIKYKAIIEVA